MLTLTPMAPITPFIQLFSQSPLRPLQKHMSIAYETATVLLAFYDCTSQSNWSEARTYQELIILLENKADTLKRELRAHLPKSLFLPVDRSDILAMLSTQDKIANQAKDIAALMLGRHMQIPEPLQDGFKNLLELSILTCAKAKQAIDEFDELLECGFRGSEIKLVETMIDELDRREHETDEVQAELRQRLFDSEKNLAPIDVIFLYKLIDFVGALADHAHDVGGKLQVLLAR
jgi:predicted phosphate transport protein (TIGR00153 family)